MMCGCMRSMNYDKIIGSKVHFSMFTWLSVNVLSIVTVSKIRSVMMIPNHCRLLLAMDGSLKDGHASPQLQGAILSPMTFHDPSPLLFIF